MEVPGKSSEMPVEANEQTEERICEPCKDFSKETKACGLCTQCEEAMCMVCFKDHKKARSCRKHELLYYEASSVFDESTEEEENVETCKEHGNVAVKFYCRKHDFVGCSECMLLGGHKICELEYITDLSKDFQKSEHFRQITKRIEKIESKHTEKLMLIQQGMKINADLKEKAVVAIKTFIAEIRDILVTTEKKLNRDVALLHAANRNLLDLEESVCEARSSKIDSVNQRMDTSRYKGNKLFINAVKCSRILAWIEGNQKETIEMDMFEFQPSEELIVTLKDTKTFGTISKANKAVLKHGINRSQMKTGEDGTTLKGENKGDNKERAKVSKGIETQFSGQQIFVRTEGGTTITINVHSTDTVADVKAKIAEKTGITRDEQTLVYGLKTLTDNQTLSEYHISTESTLNLRTQKPMAAIVPET